MRKKLEDMAMLVYMMVALGQQTKNPRTKYGYMEVNDTTKVEPPIPKGLKLFSIDGVEVYALNKKNAIRKANKITSQNQ